MFDSLHIQGFRCFEDLLIHGLGTVNLLVGKNNVGKTTVLEAIKLRCAGTAAVWEMERLLKSRGEIKREFPEEGEPRQQWNLERLFCCSPEAPGQVVSTRLSIGPVNAPESTLTLELCWAREVRDPSGEMRREILTDIAGFQDDPDILEAVVLAFGETTRRILVPGRMPRFAPRPRPDVSHADIGTVNCHYVPARGLSGNKAADLWDKVVLTDLESDVVNALRIIEPTIERISFIKSGARTESRVAVIRRSGRGRPEPLNSLGDGMNRIFETALGLVNAKGGVMLIDEFENGIHYGVQEELWSFIFETASRLGSQVFVTTHSWDCIESFQKAASAHPAAGVLVGLYERDNKVSARTFDEHRLEILTRESIEVR